MNYKELPQLKGQSLAIRSHLRNLVFKDLTVFLNAFTS